MTYDSKYYIADPEPLKTDKKHEIEDAFNDWDKELIAKYSTYDPDYRHIKEATDRLIRGEYDIMDYKAYKFYYKCLMYKHQCIIVELDNYVLLHPDLTEVAAKVVDDIRHCHLDFLIEYTGKYKKADNLVKKPMKWSKLRSDEAKAKIENFDVKKLEKN